MSLMLSPKQKKKKKENTTKRHGPRGGLNRGPDFMPWWSGSLEEGRGGEGEKVWSQWRLKTVGRIARRGRRSVKGICVLACV